MWKYIFCSIQMLHIWNSENYREMMLKFFTSQAVWQSFLYEDSKPSVSLFISSAGLLVEIYQNFLVDGLYVDQNKLFLILNNVWIYKGKHKLWKREFVRIVTRMIIFCVNVAIMNNIIFMLKRCLCFLSKRRGLEKFIKCFGGLNSETQKFIQ